MMKPFAQTFGHKAPTLCSLERCQTWEQCEKANRCQFDQITDTVLAYKPKPKSKPAKKRARRKRKIQKRESSI